ncbi:hypothetical protein [Achromobacter anxifer]|uniref:Uncharacterized protein n=1 Tax=Achromobacter anxifer TaxID=1287737 RepID=A0A6S7E369_9BURK|nr:hypothetical protein [Achromobacter anxifer]MDF8364127.1 hypothetical protein [Achromobacter anxifer]CAB3893906.1 hypothetical protein LMG26858_03875 [Achromobacter anxifer]
MTMNSAPDAQARRLELAAGASRKLVLGAGATLVCVSGSVRVEEPATGPEAAGGLPGAVSVRINAGEGHGLAYGGVARVTAIGAAEVICLDKPGLLGRFLRAATTFFQVNSTETGKNALGALHKISK